MAHTGNHTQTHPSQMSSVELGPSGYWGYPQNSWETWQGNPIPFLPASLSFPASSHASIPEPLKGLIVTHITGYKHCCPDNHDITLTCIIKNFRFA